MCFPDVVKTYGHIDLFLKDICSPMKSFKISELESNYGGTEKNMEM